MLRCPTPPAIAVTPTGPLRATVRPPGSKGITIRSLICAALADGQSTIHRAADDDDTRAVVALLRQWGIPVEMRRGGTQITVDGCRGRTPASPRELDFAGSDTTMRFLVSWAASSRGAHRLHGVPWLRNGHHQELSDTLGSFGVATHLENGNGQPVLVVDGDGLDGGTATIQHSVSGQLLSGLLMVAPYARQNVTLRLAGRFTARPRLMLTLAVMRAFHVEIPFGPDLTRIDVDVSQSYRGRTYTIEPDAAAASCFWAAAAITRGMITVEGMSLDSLQGHVAFCDCLERMGCRVEYGPNAVTVVGKPLSGITVNMSAVGNSLPTIATVALFANSPTIIRTATPTCREDRDRIRDLALELRKLGATIIESKDSLKIVPGQIRGAEVDTHDDHRLAMSLALAGLRVPGVIIRDPHCTTKAYPTYFEELMALGD